MTELIYFIFGSATTAVIFFAMNIHFKKLVKPMGEQIAELQGLYNSMNLSTDASLKYYEKLIRDMKATPSKSVEVTDTMTMLDKKQGELHESFLYLREEIRESERKFKEETKQTYWNEVKSTHARLNKMEERISELSPYHRHLHKEAKPAKKPLLPKATGGDIPRFNVSDAL